MDSSTQGANNNQRLMAAAREDNLDMLLEIFTEGGFDINSKDGEHRSVVDLHISVADANVKAFAGCHVGALPPALHYAASHGSLEVLEHILSHDECDVDPVNRLEGATPLHLAVAVGDLEVREAVVDSLLDAGADTRIRNKHGDTAYDLVAVHDTQVQKLFREAQVATSISRDDVASYDEGGPGSGSD